MTKNVEPNVEVVSDLVEHQYPRGTVLPASTFGIELPRLLELGAIRETDKPVNWPGPNTRTLTEALQSESSPTLPNAPQVNASVAEVKAKMGAGAPPDAGVTTARTTTPRPTPKK
jgi:hypothetical protein